MKQHAIYQDSVVVVLLTGCLMLAGCAAQPKGPSDALQASREVNYAIEVWTLQRDYHRAVAALEDVLDDYRGDSFEQSVLTVLALVHLDHGNREAFLESAESLELTIERRDYIPLQTQHVLLVAGAMNGRPREELPGRGYDSAHGRTVYGLLQAGE